MLTAAALRQRWTGLFGASVALVLGVGILTATALLYTSARPRVPERYAGAAVLVTSPAAGGPAESFAEPRPWSLERAQALVERLCDIPGVTDAVAVHAFYTQAVVDGRPVPDPVDPAEPQGHAWSETALGPYRLLAGRPPAHESEVVLGEAIGPRPGARVTLLTARGPADYTVTGTVRGRGYYLSDPAAARLAPGVRVIGLVVDRTADRARIVEATRGVVGGDGVVLAGAARSAAEPQRHARIRWIGGQVLAAMAALAAFVACFVVASTFAFAVTQRRRELGLLRTVGATPRQVRRSVYGEALLLGTAAAAVGVVAGSAAAPGVAAALVSVGFEPPGFGVRWHAGPPAAAFGAGLVVALLGVWSAARRAARVRPLEALREAVVEPRPMTRIRWVTGGAFTGLGVVLAALTAGADPRDLVTLPLYTAMALILGLALLAPAVVPPVVRALTAPLDRLRGATGLLVRRSMLTAVRRTAATAAPVLLTVGFAVLISGMAETAAGAYAARRTTTVPPGAVVVAHRTPGLSDAAVVARPGLSLLRTTLYAVEPAEPVDAAGVEPGGPRLGAGLDGLDAMVASESTAARHGWRAGGVATVTFADGTKGTLRVSAVVPDRSVPVGVLLAREAVRVHDPSALTEAVFVRDAGGERLPPRLGAKVVSTAEWAAAADAAEDRLVRMFVAILIAISAGYGAIAIANTLLMAAAHRVRDVAAVRLAGATNRQVATALGVEAGVVVAIGTGLGLVVALIALFAIRSGLRAQVGVPVAVALSWPVVGAAVATCLTLAVGASLLPVRMALRSGGLKPP